LGHAGFAVAPLRTVASGLMPRASTGAGQFLKRDQRAQSMPESLLVASVLSSGRLLGKPRGSVSVLQEIETAEQFSKPAAEFRIVQGGSAAARDPVFGQAARDAYIRDDSSEYIGWNKWRPSASRKSVLFEIEVIAAALRILLDFSQFCRVKLLIFNVFFAKDRTLDLRIGVRIPASQPNQFNNLADSSPASLD